MNLVTSASPVFKPPSQPRFGVLKVGLTGGIASGKSMVGAYLNELGVPTIDSDDVTHELLRDDIDLKAEIRNAFGDGVFAADGSVDRQKLGALVFGNEAKRKQLEKLIHPKVRQKTEDFFERHKNDKLAVNLVPLLFEANLAASYDTVWFVKVTKKQQIQRLMKNRGMTRKEAEARIASQMSLREKLKALKKLTSYAVIDNGGTVEKTKAQVDSLVSPYK